ncbi:MAG: helix-turn-helix domain-containing protein [Pseudolabrys sp.]
MFGQAMIKRPTSLQSASCVVSADYLGLTIETVSRSLMQLENAATIALPSSRHIILCNRKALSRLTS